MHKPTFLYRPLVMVFFRFVMFFVIQSVFALGFQFAGKNQAWELSGNYWPVVVTLTNIINVIFLIRFFRQEGKSYWEIFRFEQSTMGKDLLVMLGVLVITAPISVIPNILLGQWLFSDPQQTLALLVRPLPYWVVVLSILTFPVTQGMAELATYFAYAMPCMEKQKISLWVALGLPVLFLSLQHISIPFLFHPPFIVWRALMFLPFALLVGLILRWRPRLFPYFSIVHIFMDLSLALMLLDVAY